MYINAIIYYLCVKKIVILTSVFDTQMQSHVEDEQKEEKKKGDSEEKEDGGEYISEEDSDKYIYEDRDNNDSISSDLAIDHHPSRECEYFFDQERVLGEANDHGEIAQDEWVIDYLYVSEKCRLLKDSTLKLKKSPGSISDTRLL